jgi:hypothetical protein
MKKCWLIRTILCLLVTCLTFLRLNAQDAMDLITWFIMQPGKFDEYAFQNHIRSILFSKKDSLGNNVLNKKVYDKNGYLVRRVDYSRKNQLDSIQGIIKRLSSTEAVIELKFARGDYYAEGEECLIFWVREYLDTVSAGNYSVLTKRYKKLPGDKIRVTTYLNGVKKETHDFTYSDGPKRKEKLPPGDTTHIKDTLVVKYQEKDWGVVKALRRYFIKGIAKPVKTEYVKYVDDSLVYHSIEEDEYDKKKRHISHSESQGVPLSRYVIKRTIYNDSTGERMETEGYNPDSGKPTRLWRYNKAGQMIYYESPEVNVMDNGRVVYHRDKASTVCTYNKKGLIEEKVSSLNDIPVEYTFYKYTYHK